ncbi:DJ-1 family glyoxalase III [Treponema lecithinolyticum]|uniref:DJ-1 family glyoxalase III n=1 Tax=Treponema lecithinolyticum TaxID=53418 RepID=UPI0028E28A98|nr:DJ-1 family glyoxalase III [Treponema lecithinolyticum]
MKNCIVLLAEGFEETEAILPVDMLRRANIGVRLAAVQKGAQMVNGAHSIAVAADTDVFQICDEIKNGTLSDAVFCPGGMGGSTNLAKSEQVRFVLEQMNTNGKIIAAICAAPALVLAPLGLLDGKSFTCYPGMEKLLPYAPHAKPEAYRAERAVLDGNLLTACGPAGASALGFELIRLLCGKKEAVSVQKAMLF